MRTSTSDAQRLQASLSSLSDSELLGICQDYFDVKKSRESLRVRPRKSSRQEGTASSEPRHAVRGSAPSVNEQSNDSEQQLQDLLQGLCIGASPRRILETTVQVLRLLYVV